MTVAPEEITDANFSALTTGTGTLTILEVWAPWCPTCRSLAPICDAVARQHPGRVRLARCDIAANRRVASELRVRSVPVVVVFASDGAEVGRVSGAFARRALRRVLEAALEHGASSGA